MANSSSGTSSSGHDTENNKQPLHDCNSYEANSRSRLELDLKVCAIYGTGILVGGTVALAVSPLVVSGIGFTAGGIAANSVAASMMSYMAPTVAGGLVATLQSVGAAGMGVAGISAVASAGGFAGTGLLVAIGRYTNSFSMIEKYTSKINSRELVNHGIAGAVNFCHTLGETGSLKKPEILLYMFPPVIEYYSAKDIIRNGLTEIMKQLGMIASGVIDRAPGVTSGIDRGIVIASSVINSMKYIAAPSAVSRVTSEIAGAGRYAAGAGMNIASAVKRKVSEATGGGYCEK